MRRLFRFVLAVILLLAALVAYVLWAPASMRPSAAKSSTQRSIPVAHAGATAHLSLEKVHSNVDAAPSPAMLEKIHALIQKGAPEICGMSDFEAAMFVLSEWQTDKTAENAAISTASTQLLQSKSAADQRLGLTLQAELVIDARRMEALRACDEDEKCAAQSPAPLPPYTAPLEPLVNRALATMDPADYAAAVHSCGRINAGPCAKVSYEGWARLEPDNAAPWLSIYSFALANKDVRGQVEASLHIMAASRFDERQLDRTPLLMSPEVTSQKPLARMMIGISALGQVASASIGSTFPLMQFCTEAAVRDPVKRNACDNMAAQLLDTDQTAFAVIIAKAIGKRAGWDAARLQALDDEKEVIMGLMVDAYPAGNQYSCSALAIGNEVMRASMTKGERRWARDLVEKSGKTYAEMAGAYRAAARAATADGIP